MRRYYKESFIAFAVVLFFDFLRLFYVITNGINNVFDFLWILLLMLLVFFTYASKDNKRLVHIICLILGYLPILFVILNLIQVSSTGLTFEFNFFFMLFEAILIVGINVLYTIELKKLLNENEENMKNNE